MTPKNKRKPRPGDEPLDERTAVGRDDALDEDALDESDEVVGLDDDAARDDRPDSRGLGDDDLDLLDAGQDEVFELGAGQDEGKVVSLEPLPGGMLPVPRAAPADSLYSYIRHVNSFPMLEQDEEFDLSRQVRDHEDAAAALKLVTSHLRLVVKIAMDFQRRFKHGVLDLIQEGNIGLMRAARKFDPDKGIKFSYYAKFWIKAYILKYIMDNWRMVKIGTTQAQRKMFYNLNKERQKLLAAGEDAGPAALAIKFNLPESQVIEMEQRMDGVDQSLDVGVSGEGTASRMDFVPSTGAGVEETTGREEIVLLLRDEIGNMVQELSPREKDILQDRLLTDEPLTLQELGQKYNITRERVRQIESRLLEKIRARMEARTKDFSQDWLDSDN